MKTIHPVEELFKELQNIQYPPEVTPPPRILPKTAFFPGGYGLWNTVPRQRLPPWPKHGVMVLGHYFSSREKWYSTISPNGGDILNEGTWLHLRKLLPRAGIQLERCFFTNAYMGLGVEHEGAFSGAGSSEFVRQCQSFFRSEFRSQQPRLILALGIPVHRFLSEVSTTRGKLAAWGRTIKQLDNSVVGPVVGDVCFGSCPPDSSTVVVALVHPSHRPANVDFRRYRDREGDDAEVAMLHDALKLAGF